jgi:hypothetical protein
MDNDIDEYTFTCKRKYKGNVTKIEIVTESVYLPDIIAEFRQYLLACGFSEKSIEKYIE